MTKIGSPGTVPYDQVVVAIRTAHGSATLPRYRAIAAGVRDLIATGQVPAGHRLPPERELALALGVSRSTVIKAYGLLRNSGWARSTVGSGTYTRRPDLGSRPKMTDLSAPHDGTAAPIGADHLINLSVARPTALAELPAAVRAVADGIADYADTSDYLAQGLPDLRASIAARYTTSGLPTTDSQIVVTAGAQQALSLTLQLLLQRRAPVLVESPTYLGVLDLLRARGAQVVAVPSGPDGPDLDALRDLGRRAPGATLFLMPTCHTVTGAAIGEPARRTIADIADRSSWTVIEDDILARLTFERDNAPPIAALRAGPTVNLGATSKLLWSGLRIGWLRAPTNLIGPLTRIKAASDLGTSVLAQLVASELLRHADQIAARRIAEATDRLELTTSLLRAYLPGWHWHHPRGGRSLWIRLPKPDGPTFCTTALQYGVSVHNGTTFCPAGKHTDHLRLMFVQPDHLLTAGIQRLATAWAHHTAAA